jgi:hypothetical protein
MNMSNAAKYTARDSATAALRKIGVFKCDYDDFIIKRDGTFYCDIEGAKIFVSKQNATAPVIAPIAVAPAPVVKAAKVKVEGKVSVSNLIRTAILEGKSNQEIWDAMGPNGSGLIEQKHHHYASWYRCELRRKGHNV